MLSTLHCPFAWRLHEHLKRWRESDERQTDNHRRRQADSQTDRQTEHRTGMLPHTRAHTSDTLRLTVTASYKMRAISGLPSGLHATGDDRTVRTTERRVGMVWRLAFGPWHVSCTWAVLPAAAAPCANMARTLAGPRRSGTASHSAPRSSRGGTWGPRQRSRPGGQNAARHARQHVNMAATLAASA